MKKLTISILTVAVFFAGLGALVDKAGAKMKSDEKALELIRQARIAIGGEQSIAAVRSLTIAGKTTTTFRFENTDRTEQGETELALQLPDKFSKMIKIGDHGIAAGEKMISRQQDVLVFRNGEGGEKVMINGKDDPEIEKRIAGRGDGEFTTKDGKKIVVRRVEGAAPGEAHSGDKVLIRRNGDDPQVANIEKVIVGGHDMKSIHEGMRHNELLRVTLSLFLTAPEGMDVGYTYGGEADVDGTACNLVNAEFAGSTVKLYLSKESSLPVMVGYTGHAAPMMFKMTRAPEGADKSKVDVVTFNRKIEGPAPEAAEFQVRFSDYRSVGGIQLPFKWTTSTGRRTTETLDVTGYEINPANIAEKFANQKVMVRTRSENK